MKRVLVMLDYGPEDADSGEVYDVTGLAGEMTTEDNWLGWLEMKVTARLQTWGEDKGQIEHVIEWSGHVLGGNLGSVSSGYLTDVINTALPDDEAVRALKRRFEKCRKNLQKVGEKVKEAKLDQVAQVRHLHPIARVTESPLALG